MTQIKFNIAYEHIISLENLLEAWKEFIRGKKNRKDVQEFQGNLIANVLSVHNDLKYKTYTHSAYEAFNVSDPKPRNIHKASVRDRLIHHAIYRILYPYFDKKFIHDSYSCRTGKGTHRASNRFRYFASKVSKNYTKTVWILKCDIRKFFASIDHQILIGVINKYIVDKNILWLISEIIGSFNSIKEGVGLPLGNLTSQIFVNIYMNEFDQYVKHKLKQKYYIRYADDFVFLDVNRKNLENVRSSVNQFLAKRLKLHLHPDKVFIKTLSSGVDFLGWIYFLHRKILRTSTKIRLFSRLKQNQSEETVASYLGLISHGNTYKIKEKIKGIIDVGSRPYQN
jgi:RNA-directed DNA polymerase